MEKILHKIYGLPESLIKSCTAKLNIAISQGRLDGVGGRGGGGEMGVLGG